MIKERTDEAYFNWICFVVNGGDSYRKLLRFLHSCDFSYTLPMDGNRADDGVDLRYRFGSLNGYSEAEIAAELDCRPCSVLEMMTALAVRCEEHIMSDPDIGDRTGKWFWAMVSNLGLIEMDDEHFDEAYCGCVIDRFLNRRYKPNGEGGLFRVKNGKDMRGIEIWYQMCWYLKKSSDLDRII